MSWDATLYDDRGHEEGSWNYTHNTNRMVNEALGIAIETDNVFREIVLGEQDETWWRILDGMSGEDGKVFLMHIIAGLESAPAKYRAMNPDNGWGDYDQLLATLREMRDAVPEWPSVWRVRG